LGIKGVRVAEEKDTIKDPEFLMHVLELSEAIEETENLDQLSKIASDVNARLLREIEVLSQSIDAEQLDKAKESLVKAIYYKKLNQEVSSRLPIT
jgi:hypothetical protein